MNRVYSLTLLFFILSITLYSLVEWFDDDKEQLETHKPNTKPTYIAENLTTDIFKNTGELSYIVKAKRMEHYANSNTTYFQEPMYELFPKNNKPTWKIIAKQGMLSDNNRITLTSRVNLFATDPTSLIKEIKGQQLEMDLASNIISSDQTILILGEGFTMYGSGLIVDLNTSQMTLTEHVQTIYNQNKY